jgi:hypothetical protein
MAPGSEPSNELLALLLEQRAAAGAAAEGDEGAQGEAAGSPEVAGRGPRRRDAEGLLHPGTAEDEESQEEDDEVRSIF